MKYKFSCAQEKWYRTISAKGFIAQTGGWNTMDETEASIISFWESKDALHYFMRNLHDQILKENKQDQFYSSIVVDHYNITHTMKGESSTFVQVINNAKLLRTAVYRVKDDSVKHFEQIQKEIWKAGIKRTNAMLRSYFSKSTKDINKYLMITFWESQENHKNYINNIQPGLIERPDLLQDLETTSGKQILLVESWKILKDEGTHPIVVTS